MTYKTGEDAPDTGKYVFESYIDADDTVPEPTANEKEILLTKGERFPPIKSTAQGAIWRGPV